MERIEGIKILHVDGLGGGGGGGGNGDGGHGGSFSDGLVNSALRFRAQAPLVDQLLREIGIEGGDIQRLVGGVERRAGRAAAGADAERRNSRVIQVYTSSVIDASADTRLVAHPRLQRHAAVASGHRRQPHRERPAERPGRLHPPLPHPRRRHDPRAAAGALRLRLLAASTRSSKARWASTNYVATLKLTPVTDGERCFAEWSAEFDCAEAASASWSSRSARASSRAASTR